MFVRPFQSNRHETVNLSAFQLKPADAAAYQRLRREMLVNAPYAFLSAPGDDRMEDPAEVEQVLGVPEQAILGIRAAGGLVSVAGIARSPRVKCRHRASIWGVYTTPSERGRGHARAVLSACIDHARSWHGVTLVGLSVSAKSAAARALYVSLGFEQWGVEPAAMRIDDEDLDEVYMVLRL